MTRYLKSGDAWRIGWHPHAAKYPGMVGADSWAIELTAAELKDFCRLLKQLAATMETMANELMDEEKISCEAETELVWLEVSGYPYDYSLRLILNRDRRCEGNWNTGVAFNLLQAIASWEIPALS